MKVEVAVLGSPSLIVLMVSVDVKQHLLMNTFRAQELCGSRGGRPGLPVPNTPYSFRGRKATLNEPPDTNRRLRFGSESLHLNLH